MAVDTRARRFSMMSFGSSIRFIPLFEADGVVDQDDRQHLLNCYGGILFDNPAGETNRLLLIHPHRTIGAIGGL